MDAIPEIRETCQRLRYKGMYVQVEPDPLVPNPSDGICWCSVTQECLGPDGAVVEKEDCIPGRECFEPY